MIKTIYFIGSGNGMPHIEISINSAIEKRDAFLNQNVNKIAKIDSEYLQIPVWGSNRGQGTAIIQLNYYEK